MGRKNEMQFRNYRIVRTCKEKYSECHQYKSSLKRDFKNRCAYCNLADDLITSYFEIDHYIPRKVFKYVWPELEIKYDNLIYSCPKCNRAKGSQFQGDISQKKIINELFYNPVTTDYNNIFYRDSSFRICSDDEKGRKMIVLLKLFDPIHQLAGIYDALIQVIDRLTQFISTKQDDEAVYSDLLDKLKTYAFDYQRCFIANYKNSPFIKKIV